MKYLTTVCLLLVAISNSSAQSDLSPQLLGLLDSMDLQLILPTPEEYRLLPTGNRADARYQQALWLRSDKLELRYYLRPEADLTHLQGMPHVATGLLLAQVMLNEDEAVLSAHSWADSTVRVDFGADWAQLVHFRPRPSFANYLHCRLLALYREGIGLAYVFFLFDKVPAKLDDYLRTLRFEQWAEVPE